MFHSEDAGRLARITDRLIATDTATAGLISAIAIAACDRADGAGQVSVRIRKLTEAGAWTDAALALISSELPRWKLRRLAYDEGEWHCTLSPQRDLPDWLDEAVETAHPDLPLALLKAFVEAKRRNSDAPEETRSPTVPRIRRDYPDLICCDNFA
ncbi:MAG: hypothetical protein V4602_20755 [Pseudomonadota bacterium]